MDLDFGYGGGSTGNNTNPPIENNNNNQTTDLDNNKVVDNNNGNGDIDNLDGKNNQPDDNNKPVNDDTIKNDIATGTTIEIGDDVYTIDESGNAIDKDGKIFKEAKDVKSWIDSFDQVNEPNDDISIDSIKSLIGIDVTDENDKPMEFENTPAGVKAYLDAVIESKREEHYETALNTLYQKYPIINDVLNYYIANGNSLEGFGQIPDRSNITIDDTNEAQQETIIRTAWKEQGRKGDVEGYINYLKSSGTLYETAKEELAGLQEADKQYRENLEKEAIEKEKAYQQELVEYWTGIKDTIDKRVIAGYQIPESFVITKNGQKVTVTPDDFYNYLYRVDANGKSAYMHDLEKTTPQSRRDDELLRAYLTFVGGDYSTLVNMAVNKNQVAKLKLKAKERTKTAVRISQPAKPNNTEIDLGYN